MAYKQLVLHVGLGKTGSTSIQKNCDRHREFLQARGIHYPIFSHGTIRHMKNHSDLMVLAVLGDPSKYNVAWRRRLGDDAPQFQQAFTEQLQRLLAEPQGDVLVLSGEGIGSYHRKDLEAIRDFFAPQAETFRVLAYVRSPQSWLESTIQQRIKGGMNVVPDKLQGSIRKRCANLQKVFGEHLEFINFHDAIRHAAGPTGSFMSLLGVPEEDLVDLKTFSSNERVSMEACMLMEAINAVYPRKAEGEYSPERRPRDFFGLNSLPGQPFHLRNFTETSLYRSAMEESAWLESHLGFEFPDYRERESLPLWQPETLQELDAAIRRTGSYRMRAVAGQFLCEQADEIGNQRAGDAAKLRAIGERFNSG